MDTIHLADEVSAFKAVTSTEKWVGGVADKESAVLGMSLNKKGHEE